MASSALVGALRATLSLDTAAFESGGKRAVGQADRLAKNLTRAFKGFSAGLIFERFVNSLKSVIDEADKLQEMAQAVGVPVEELSKLSFAADLSGASMESLTTSVGKLSRVLTEAITKPTSESANAFRSLGLSMEQLGSATPLQAFEAVADAFQRIPDGARQAYLANALFGRGFKEVLPLLNQGSAAIRASGEELRQFGAVITTTFARDSDTLNDNLRKIRAFIDGLRIQLLEELMPALITASNDFIEFLKSFDIGNYSGSAFSDFVKATIGDLYRLGSAATQVMIFFTGLGDVIENIGSGRQLEIWQKTFAEIGAETDRLNAKLNVLRGGLGGVAQKRGEIGAPPLVNTGGEEPEIVTTPKKAKPFWDNLSKSIKLTDEELGKLPPILEEVGELFDGIGGQISDVFFDAIEGTKSLADGFRDLANSLLRDATRLFADRAFQLLLGMFMGPQPMPVGVGPGGMGFTHFGGPRQHGGRVGRGRSFLVGERGPEMFSPRTAGTIIPNGALAKTDIRIIDQRTTASPRIEPQQGADGSMDFVVRDTVRRILPGELNRQMPQQFGARPRLNQRGS